MDKETRYSLAWPGKTSPADHVPPSPSPSRPNRRVQEAGALCADTWTLTSPTPQAALWIPRVPPSARGGWRRGCDLSLRRGDLGLRRRSSLPSRLSRPRPSRKGRSRPAPSATHHGPGHPSACAARPPKALLFQAPISRITRETGIFSFPPSSKENSERADPGTRITQRRQDPASSRGWVEAAAPCGPSTGRRRTWKRSPIYGQTGRDGNGPTTGRRHIWTRRRREGTGRTWSTV